MSQRASGSIGSYVAGFILSLGLTGLAYYLVVNKTITGNQLLAAIVGVALVQMLVQVIFFLHLGRGPKPFYNIVFFGATVGIIALVVGGSLFIMNHLHYNMLPTNETTKQLAEDERIYQVEGTKTGACQQIKTNHQIVIVNGQANPVHTDAQLCDTLSVTNQDNQTRQMAFGLHNSHLPYDGISEKSLRKGQSFMVTLIQTGNFRLHDHFDDSLQATFSVDGSRP